MVENWRLRQIGILLLVAVLLGVFVWEAFSRNSKPESNTSGSQVLSALGARVKKAPAQGPLRKPGSSPKSTQVPTTSTVPPSSTSAPLPQVDLSSVLWAEVSYPQACPTSSQAQSPTSPPTGQGGLSPTVKNVRFMVPNANTSLAVVLVQCGSSGGPIGLYVYDGATSATTPSLSQTLIPLSQGVVGNNLIATTTQVSIKVTSTNPQVSGACCAGLAYTLSWVWTNGGFHAN